jgi:hypothetical protein
MSTIYDVSLATLFFFPGAGFFGGYHVLATQAGSFEWRWGWWQASGGLGGVSK